VQKDFQFAELPVLDLLLGAMQNHHPGLFPSLKGTLRNQFPWQNVIVIAESCAHLPEILAQKYNILAFSGPPAAAIRAVLPFVDLEPPRPNDSPLISEEMSSGSEIGNGGFVVRSMAVHAARSKQRRTPS
jgi:hypothetical protein